MDTIPTVVGHLKERVRHIVPAVVDMLETSYSIYIHIGEGMPRCSSSGGHVRNQPSRYGPDKEKAIYQAEIGRLLLGSSRNNSRGGIQSDRQTWGYLYTRIYTVYIHIYICGGGYSQICKHGYICIVYIRVRGIHTYCTVHIWWVGGGGQTREYLYTRIYVL